MSILIVSALSFTYNAFAQTDTIEIMLGEVTLSAHRNNSAISGSITSGLRIDARIMDNYPKLFGYTDPMRYLQSLPGISTNSESMGGLHVQGCENYHNQFMLSGVPVYGASHFTGLFSTFNQDHFPDVTFRNVTNSTFLGGQLSLEPIDSLPHMLSGTATLGLISTQFNIVTPLTQNTALSLSARRTFINTFYGNLLQFNGNPLRYGFTDANMTFLYKPDKNNTLDINLFYSNDHGECNYADYKMNLGADWGNAFAAARWRHTKGRWSTATSVFMTGYMLDGYIYQETTRGSMPAHTVHYGIKSDNRFAHDIRLNASLSYYDILPQDPSVSSNKAGTSIQDSQQAFEADLYMDKRFSLGHSFSITPGLLTSAYSEAAGYRSINFDPSINLQYDLFRYGTITLDAGIRHQYLAQTGMTDCSLPIEFWVAAGRYFKPQESLFTTLTYEQSFLDEKYSLTVQAYAHRLHNQIEYTGFIVDLLTRPYRLENNIHISSGYSYGASVMLARQAGKLTGWISYAYGRSLREGDGISYPKLFPSSHERLHEFNAVLNYATGRFEFGGSFVAASGNPFTPPRNLYFISNSVIVQYDEFNSGQLNPYVRLDLSATYNLKSHGRYRHSVNLSLYNATAHSNETMGYIKVDEDEMSFKYHMACFIIPVMPSISYNCHF